MNSVIKAIIAVLVALIVVIAGGAYLIAPESSVERAAAIAAPPDKVFAIVANMRRFNEWSPWADLDPATVYSFSGPETGVGQKMSWTSANPDVGNGALTITELVPGERIRIELDFGAMGKAQSAWTFAPADGGTAAVWSFSVKADGVMERWMSLMFDKWIGADYEKGLGRLKALAEREQAGG